MGVRIIKAADKKKKTTPAKKKTTSSGGGGSIGGVKQPSVFSTPQTSGQKILASISKQTGGVTTATPKTSSSSGSKSSSSSGSGIAGKILSTINPIVNQEEEEARWQALSNSQQTAEIKAASTGTAGLIGLAAGTAAAPLVQAAAGYFSAKLAGTPAVKFAEMLSSKSASLRIGRTGALIKGGTKTAAAGMNTKSGALITKLGVKVGLTIAAAYLVKSIVESYGMAGWAKKETLDPLQTYTANAIKDLNDSALINERAAILDEIDNPELWESIVRKLPYANQIYWSAEAVKTNAWGAKVGSAILKNQATALETGQTADEVARQQMMSDWSAYNQQKMEQEQQMILWEEAQRDRDAAEDAAIKREEDAYYRAQRKKERQEEADFWRKYKLWVIEQERLQAEELAKFWLDYRKQLMKIQEESGRSRLGFGLL